MMKNRIVETASDLYAIYGIKGISMDEIAKSMSISKRTLYDFFDSKEHLVNEVVIMTSNQLAYFIQDIEDRIRSPLGKVVAISLNTLGYYKNFCPAFYKNLVRYNTAYKYLNEKTEHFHQRLYVNFEQGKKSGVFYPDVDYENIADVFISHVRYTPEEHQETTIITFIRGVCTPDGLNELTKCLNSDNKFINTKYRTNEND